MNTSNELVNSSSNNSIILQVFNSGYFNFQNGKVINVNKPSYLLSTNIELNSNMLSSFKIPNLFLKPVDTFLSSTILLTIILVFVTTCCWGLIFTNLLFNNSSNSIDITVYLDTGPSSKVSWLYYTKVLVSYLFRSSFKNEMTISLGCYLWALCISLTRFSYTTFGEVEKKQFDNNYMSFAEFVSMLFSDRFNVFALILIEILYMICFLQFLYDCCFMMYNFEKSMKRKRKQKIVAFILVFFFFCLLLPSFIFAVFNNLYFAIESRDYLKLQKHFEGKNADSSLPYTLFTNADRILFQNFYKKYSIKHKAFFRVEYAFISSVFNFIATVIAIFFVFHPINFIAQKKINALQSLFIANMYKHNKISTSQSKWNLFFKYCKNKVPNMVFNLLITACLLALLIIEMKTQVNQLAMLPVNSLSNLSYKVVDSFTETVLITNQKKKNSVNQNTDLQFLKWLQLLIYLFQLLQFINMHSTLSDLKIDLKFYELQYNNLTLNKEDDNKNDSKPSISDSVSDESGLIKVVDADTVTMSIFTFTTKKTKKSDESMFRIPNLLHFNIFEEPKTPKSDSENAVLGSTKDCNNINLNENSDLNNQVEIETVEHGITEI
ncbi:hypothetical protein QEN19_001142 [Hanseniaspora menglaensis]